MNLKITKKRKDYITGPDFTVYELDGLPQFNIRVNSSAGWSTDPHDKRGRELRLMDRGKRKATIYWKEGNLKVLAKQMYDLTSKTTWGEDRGLTPDDYYEVLKMWVDMGLHESTNKTNLVEKLNTLLEKNVPTNPSKWSYYKSQAKKKFDVYPSAYANAWAAKKYKAAGGGWKKESVSEYSRDDIHDNTPLHFGSDSKLGGLLYNRLKSKLNREYGVNKFKVVGRVVMLGNKRLFTITGNMSLNDIFYKILSTIRNFGLKVNEEYYDSLKPHDGYIDAEKLIGKRLWFHTNRSHAIQGRNGMVGIYTVTSNGTKKSLTKNYTNEVRLKSPIHFQTSESGAKRIQKSKETQGGAGTRMLIAGVSGVVIPTKSGNLSGMQQARFNPFDKQAPWFHLVSDSDKKEIVSADEVYFRADENTPDNMRWYIYVKNPKFSGKSKKQLKKENNMNLREWTDNYIKSISSNINEDLPTKEIDPKQFPNPLPSDKKGFLKKGNYDGDKTDDIVATKPVQIAVSKLKPSQSAIYLGKALGMAVGGVEGGDLGAVISKDNYILDGHHRYAATTFNNPSAKVGGVQSDLMIGDLVPVLRAVGDAMKNKRGLAPKGGDVNIFKATMKDVKDAIYNGKNMDSKFYNKEKSIAWFEKIGEETIAKRLKMLQSKRPPSGAPARKDMPKIHPNQLGILKTLLNKGNIDVRKPYTESVNEADIDTKLLGDKMKADMIRKSMPGYVGTKFAKKASDEDILAMADLKDEKAKIYNKYLKDVMAKISNLQKKYNVKESVNEARTEWYEIDEWKERLEKAISKSNLNPKEKRYLQLRAYKIRSKHDAVDILNDLDNMVKKKVNESNFKYDPSIDYFDDYELLPKKVQDILDTHDFDEESYKAAKQTIKKLNKVGWTADYDLSGDMFDLKPLGESVNEAYTGNPGDKLTHKYDKRIEIELIEPTNRGWKVKQTTNGKKSKIAYFDKQDIVGDKSLFESVNEAMDKSQLKAIYDKLQKGDELTIMYTDMWSGKTRGNFMVKKGKTKVGKAKVERITLINKRNPRGVRYYLYQRNGFVTFAVGDMAATIDSIVLEESLNEAVSSSKIKASLDKQIDWANIADDEIKLYPKPIRIEPDKFDSQLKKYSKAFKNPLIYLYGTTTNKYNTTALFAVVSRLKSTTKIIFMSDKYAKAYGKGSLKDSDINGVLKMNSLIASNAELNESVNEANDYFKTASQAVDYARKMIEKRGFEIDEDDWNTSIVQGGKYNRLRPGVDKTHSYSIGLLKNGKPQRKELQISLYGMPSGNYELTYYVN